jgi:ribosomal protein L37AE/L43A
MSRKRKNPLCVQCGKNSAKYPREGTPMFCCLQCALDYATLAVVRGGYVYNAETVAWEYRPTAKTFAIGYIPEPSGYVAAISNPGGGGVGAGGETTDPEAEGLGRNLTPPKRPNIL